MAVTQINLWTNICFYKYAHNSGLKFSPDMNLSAFDMKVHEKQIYEITPVACRLPKSETQQCAGDGPTKVNNQDQKNSVQNMDPKKVETRTMCRKWFPRPSARAGGLVVAAPREEKEGVCA